MKMICLFVSTVLLGTGAAAAQDLMPVLLYVKTASVTLPSTDTGWDYVKFEPGSARLFMARLDDGLTLFDVDREAVGAGGVGGDRADAGDRRRHRFRTEQLQEALDRGRRRERRDVGTGRRGPLLRCERGGHCAVGVDHRDVPARRAQPVGQHRSEEHTSELQSLMRISYAV